MQYTQLGNTGIRVSKICFGTLTMGPLQRNMTAAEGARLLEYAFERGVNFLDTAEIYDNYEHIALAIKHHKDTVIATKCYAYDEATATESYEKAVRGLGREYIDVFMLHEQESAHTLRGHAEAVAFFAKKKEQGYIGQLGVSTHFVACANAALKYPELTVVHPLINRKGLGICDGTPDEMLAAIEALHAQGKGIYAMKPLGGGHMAKDARASFDYLLGQTCIDAIAVGMQSTDEIDFNIAYFNGLPIEAKTEAAVKSAQRRLLINDWCEGCGVCVKACKGGALRLEEGKAQVDHAKCVLCGYCGAACPQFCIKVV